MGLWVAFAATLPMPNVPKQTADYLAALVASQQQVASTLLDVDGQDLSTGEAIFDSLREVLFYPKPPDKSGTVLSRGATLVLSSGLRIRLTSPRLHGTTDPIHIHFSVQSLV